MDGERRLVACTHQVLIRDYDDALEPGYRFCPTDSELIDYYLKRKIQLGEQPRCRIYDVHVYAHHPNELTELYRSCEDKWYFFTIRESKYTKGSRVNRRTKNFGVWKSTQKDKAVYDFVTKRAVGTKRSLAFHDHKNQKTSWLMHEYTCYNDPNPPSGSHVNKLTDWVLCKIYKKESTRSVDHNSQTGGQHVQSTRNIQREIPQQQNQLDMTASMFQSNHQQPAVNHIGYNYDHLLVGHVGLMNTNNNSAPITTCMQPAAVCQEQVQSFSAVYQNLSISASTDVRDDTYQQEDSQTLVNMESCYMDAAAVSAIDDDSGWDPQEIETLWSCLDG